MKRAWLIPLGVAVAAGLLAFGVARRTGCGPAEPALGRLQDVSFLVRELNLTDTQARQIRELHVPLETRLQDCCNRHCAARMRLGEALRREAGGEDGPAEAILQEMLRTYEASERVALDHIRRVRAVLDETQRTRFDELMTRCMCRNCDGACCNGAAVPAGPAAKGEE